MTIVIEAIRPSTVFAPVAGPDRPRAIPGRNRVMTATPRAERGDRQAAGGLPPQTEPPGVFATEVLGTCHELTPGWEERNQPSRVAALARLVLPCANPRLTKGSIAAAVDEEEEMAGQEVLAEALLDQSRKAVKRWRFMMTSD